MLLEKISVHSLSMDRLDISMLTDGYTYNIWILNLTCKDNMLVYTVVIKACMLHCFCYIGNYYDSFIDHLTTTMNQS